MEIKDNLVSAMNTLQSTLNTEDMEHFLYELKTTSIKYSAAMKQVETYIDILEEDYNFRYNDNPIEHISSRIKSAQSIINKMKKNNVEFTTEALEKNILDLAGIRIICSFESDIFKLVNLLKENKYFTVIKEKDYITNPKPSGYRSYHLIVLVDVHLISGHYSVPVEIQIRTMAMDFWASLEHKIKYKFDGTVPDSIKDELQSCSVLTNALDQKMMELNNIVKIINE